MAIATRSPWFPHVHLPELARQVGKPRTTVFFNLRRLVEAGVLAQTPGGWRLASDVLVTRKGEVYRQLWLFDEAEAA